MQVLQKLVLLACVTVPIVYMVQASLTWAGVQPSVIFSVLFMFVPFFICMALISLNKSRSNGDDKW